MKFNEATVRILVRKDYGACFDFYKEKLGLVPTGGDRNGVYTSFSMGEGEPACLAIFAGKEMSKYKGYEQPTMTTQPDTVVTTIPTDDFAADYQRLKEAGIEFIGEPQFIPGWEMTCVYFRDPEGNLFELMDGYA